MRNIAYHFTGNTLKDGTPVPAIGVKLVFSGEPILCKQGLHFSLDPFDALQYAPGHMLHKVQYGGVVRLGNDKGVCTERTIIASIDATHMLRKFACDEALRVLPIDAPYIVRRYLTTRDETLRTAACTAARAAAWAAAWTAAWDVERDVAWSAARAAALDAARDAALDAARAAARAAAQAAAQAAARGAARDAARYAARYAARDAAWYAAWDAQRVRFNKVVKQAFEGK